LFRLSTEEPEDMDALNKELEDVSSKDILFYHLMYNRVSIKRVGDKVLKKSTKKYTIGTVVDR